VTADTQPVVAAVAVADETLQRWLLQGSSVLLLAASERRGSSPWGEVEFPSEVSTFSHPLE